MRFNDTITALRTAVANAAMAFTATDPATVAVATEALRDAVRPLWRRPPYPTTPEQLRLWDEEERAAMALLGVMDAAARAASARYALAHHADAVAVATALAKRDAADPVAVAAWRNGGYSTERDADDIATAAREAGITLDLTIPEVMDDVADAYAAAARGMIAP
jgi:hypothetical protein